MMWLDDISPTTAAATVVVVILSIAYYLIKNRNILPGPRGFPYFGLLFELTDENGHLQLQEYGKKYGDLFSFNFGGRLFINLGSPKAMREMQVNNSDCFSERITDFNILTHTIPEGLPIVNGDRWRVLRKFFTQAFKDYGLTIIRDNTVGPVYDSLAQTLEDIRARKGEPFNVIELLTERCTCTMRKVLFGEEGISDEDMREMLRAFDVAIASMTGVKLMLIGTIAKFVFKMFHRKSLKEHALMRSILYKTVKRMKSTMDESNPSCIVEAFYTERNARKKNNDPTWKYFSDDCLAQTLAQVVGDGIVSIAYFIGIFLYGAVEHPEEQEKIYNELIEVLGPDRLPSVEERSKLKYTNAFINEVMRTSNFFPLLPSLQCSKETTVRGYTIPKGSITLLNSWHANHDPKTFENPDKFDPSRYIATPEKPRAELPVLFGMGKRSCPGEAFATTQGFLYLTSIVKNFKIMEPENPTTKSNLFLMTGNMELCIKPRTEN